MSWHARLSASSAHRWLVCPRSAEYAKSGTSVYAAEGTLAHDIAAKCLADPSLSASDFLLKQETVEGFKFEVGQEMVDVVQFYIDALAADEQEDDEGWVEMPLHDQLKGIDPDLGGTADAVAFSPATKKLRVYDFKYGSGSYVEADDNPQLKLYALGALLVVQAAGRQVLDVEVVIVQPRFEGANPVRRFQFKAFDLLDFIADVKAAALQSRTPSTPLVAGDHCQFCGHAKDCEKLKERQHAIVAAEFKPLLQYDPAALAQSLADIPLVKARIKALEEFAYTEACRGVTIPGYKLVDKRPTRKWAAEGPVWMWAQENAIDAYAPRELLSPAQMEKKIAETLPRGKKKEAAQAIEHLVVKVSSGVALVPESDDRPVAQRISVDEFPQLNATL